MLRRAKRRRFCSVFLSVWMTAQLLPVTLCRLLEPTRGPAFNAHADLDHHAHGAHSPSDVSAPADDRHANSSADPDCCDDPLASCCVDSLRTTLLVSRDGTGGGDFLVVALPPTPVVIVPLVPVLRTTPARFLGPPVHLPKTTVLQI